ncbi:MAG: shikimate dehydrogenase [Deltaproteobacteria bacterium]|nr:shikimate dehydrogenase [Deltaproteobacteria bacterium]
MIDGNTKVFGILGQPVGHSLSPAMHNAAFQTRGVNAVYVAFPVQNLEQAVLGLRGLDIGGVSVTIPFKEAIIPLLDDIDAKAAAMGAVNTVINQQGRLQGCNTDYLGAIAALKDRTEIKGQHFLLLGAGGAARAIAFGIIEAGGQVTITDIDWDRAQTLARELQVESIALHDLAHCPAAMLINATPVGMAPATEEIPIAPELLGRFSLVMDIVYRPLKTRLLQETEARGGQTIDGLQMLIYQGVVQFELFTGRSAPVEVMRQAALAALSVQS